MESIKTIKLVLAGYGTAARALTELLLEQRERLYRQGLSFQVVAVADRRGAALCPDGFPLAKLHIVAWDTGAVMHYPEYGRKGLTALEAIELSGADMLIEATPSNFVDGEPARTHVLQALALGMDVVMASKGALALHWRELHEAAARYKRQLGYSCAASAGLEVLPLAEALGSSGELLSLRGIFNATSQYVLERRLDGISQQDAVKEAQERGFAERDPSLDLGGFDTAVKLLLQSNAAWSCAKTIRDVEIRGLESISERELQEARQAGGKISLVGEAEWREGDLRLRVSPELLRESDPLYRLGYSDKAVQLRTRSQGEQVLYGLGGSASGTAGSILKDMVRIALRR